MDAKRARIGDKRSEGSRFGATFYDVACASLVMELILLALIGEELPFSAGPGMPYNEDGIFEGCIYAPEDTDEYVRLRGLY